MWRTVLEILKDKKAKQIIVLDLREISLITDFMIICSGTSNVHIKSIYQGLIEEMKKRNNRIYGNEGLKTNKWVLVDLGEVIVHIMNDELRQFYGLERLWSNAKIIYPMEAINLTIA